MPRFAVILPAAGKSSRFGDAHRKKPFVDLKGRPVWVRAIEPFLALDSVVQALVVVSPDDLEWFRDKFRPNLAFMNVELVEGGAERADSVQNALARVKSDVDFVAVHDAARPLIVKKWIQEVFAAAEKSSAAILACPVSSTLKRVKNSGITETVSREGIYEAQTPQVFSRKLLLDAYAKRDGFVATDEAQLVERIGQTVSIVECSPLNRKITTRDDLRMAEALLNVLPKDKIPGQLHPFAEDTPHLFDL